MIDVPAPGEVWIVTEPKYGPEYWERIKQERPFILTYVSVGFIGYVCAGDGTDPEVGRFPRYGPHAFSWHEHCTRIWPPVPSWDELREGGVPLATDDLRAQ